MSAGETVQSLGAIPGAAPDGTLASNLTKDFFTIYDFIGYIPGSAQAAHGMGVPVLTRRVDTDQRLAGRQRRLSQSDVVLQHRRYSWSECSDWCLRSPNDS